MVPPPDLPTVILGHPLPSTPGFPRSSWTPATPYTVSRKPLLGDSACQMNCTSTHFSAPHPHHYCPSSGPSHWCPLPLLLSTLLLHTVEAIDNNSHLLPPSFRTMNNPGDAPSHPVTAHNAQSLGHLKNPLSSPASHPCLHPDPDVPASWKASPDLP